VREAGRIPRRHCGVRRVVTRPIRFRGGSRLHLDGCAAGGGGWAAEGYGAGMCAAVGLLALVIAVADRQACGAMVCGRRMREAIGIRIASEPVAAIPRTVVRQGMGWR